MTDARPLPQLNPDNRPFWEGCREHRLKIQKCSGCGALRWPPAFLCPHCLAAGTEWVAAGGTGSVYTYAVYHVAPFPAFKDELPYVVAIVSLDEGPRMMTNIVGCDPEAVYCGMPVEVTWDDETGEFSIPRFRPRN
jgi:hypothetical protein